MGLFPGLKLGRRSWGEGLEAACSSCPSGKRLPSLQNILAQEEGAVLLPKEENPLQMYFLNTVVLCWHNILLCIFLLKNKTLHSSLQLLGFLFPPTCTVKRAPSSSEKGAFFFFFDVFKMSSFRLEQTQLNSCVLNFQALLYYLVAVEWHQLTAVPQLINLC